MKASEFVAQIQALIAEHGDLDIAVADYWGNGSLRPAIPLIIQGGVAKTIVVYEG